MRVSTKWALSKLALSEADNSRKHALECLRLATDCMQLAGDLHNPALQTHFVRMAKEWTGMAVRGQSVDI
jgi:hypothetical protein